MQRATKKIPAIVTGIDGVLTSRGKLLPNVSQTLHQIFTPHSGGHNNGHSRFPFLAMTNESGILESEKADELNKLIGMKALTPFSRSNVITGVTSLRDELAKFKDKVVLFFGRDVIDSLCQEAGIRKYITSAEVVTLFPTMVPISRRDPVLRNSLVPHLVERFGVSAEYFDEPFPVDAMFFVGHHTNWEEGVQVVMDYVSEGSGHISKTWPERLEGNKIPIHAIFTKVHYPKHFHLPRLADVAFIEACKFMYKTAFHGDLQIQLHGKPFPKVFHLAEGMIRSNHPADNIGKFYMIGDNYEQDIAGANKVGWTSIFVRDEGNPIQPKTPEEKPHHTVESFQKAIELIMQLEQLPTINA